MLSIGFSTISIVTTHRSQSTENTVKPGKAPASRSWQVDRSMSCAVMLLWTMSWSSRSEHSPASPHAATAGRKDGVSVGVYSPFQTHGWMPGRIVHAGGAQFRKRKMEIYSVKIKIFTQNICSSGTASAPLRHLIPSNTGYSCIRHFSKYPHQIRLNCVFSWTVFPYVLTPHPPSRNTQKAFLKNYSAVHTGARSADGRRHVSEPVLGLPARKSAWLIQFFNSSERKFCIWLEHTR